ncbi:MAG TPA: pyridoxamine 5'-phosphate oxidase family protein [Actinophytocola sp.]|uniref:pyridoxamine 5'-phosphate oxidase family protein n=1 Tax=Actinophytocola sp. TaxID=1872138 RepID=UPI002DB9A73A|nr:pyridoxamine 5'-phosphate oxidase family protein [Actinophytocola sp.]HEU5472565.1 pyridoxamine 5'-phosphate oxidase family protein [Actinophytocola sp.]
MVDRTPVDVTNLDGYGNPALDWNRAAEALAAGPASGSFFLGTTGPDGRPHAAAVGALWRDGELFIVSGPGTRKSRNLAANPACTVSASLTGIDIVIEGEARRVTDATTLERVVGHYRDQGWPAEVQGDAFTAPYSAPSAGPPPWYLYLVTPRTVFGVGGSEPPGATRWRFAG